MSNAMDKILQTYARYAQDDTNLAVTLTARELDLEESTVRMAVES